MYRKEVYLGEWLKKAPVTWGSECYIFVKIDNEALYILEKEDDRKNAMFGEHYHANCISNQVDQRQTRAKERPVSFLM